MKYISLMYLLVYELLWNGLLPRIFHQSQLLLEMTRLPFFLENELSYCKKRPETMCNFFYTFFFSKIIKQFCVYINCGQRHLLMVKLWLTLIVGYKLRYVTFSFLICILMNCDFQFSLFYHNQSLIWLTFVFNVIKYYWRSSKFLLANNPLIEIRIGFRFQGQERVF